jgi:hypothetical protein
MKLFKVTLPKEVSFVDVRETAKKVDPYVIVTVVAKDRIYEVQDKLVADELVRVYNGKVELIEYDVRDLLH